MLSEYSYSYNELCKRDTGYVRYYVLGFLITAVLICLLRRELPIHDRIVDPNRIY